MPDLLLVSVVPLFAAFLLGAVDGLYFHLRRYRLFAFPESRREHVLHTVRAFLVLPPLALLYLADATGLWLWTAAAAIAIDQLILALDLREEATSRRRFGGLGPVEYPIHVAANGCHGIALALALASRPTTAWSLTAGSVGASSLPVAIETLVGVLWLASAVAVVQHVVLLFGERTDAAVVAP